MGAGFFEGRAAVYLGAVGGFIDESGKRVIPLAYEDVGDFSEGLAWVVRNNRCGYVDRAGRVTIPLQFFTCGDFSHGIAHVYVSEYSMGYVNKAWHWVISPQFENGWYFSDRLAAVSTHGNSDILTSAASLLFHSNLTRRPRFTVVWHKLLSTAVKPLNYAREPCAAF